MYERLRLGVIVPSSNTVVEADFAGAVPPGVTVHVARMYLAETTAAGEHNMLERHLPQAAIDLGSAHPHLAVFSCTSAAALLGDEGELRLVNDLTRSVGAPVISTNAAVGRALPHVGARVAILTPYVEELSEAIAGSLSRKGLEIAKVVSLGMTDNFSIAEVEPDEIVRVAVGQLGRLEFDVLFVSCTNLRAVEAKAQLERELSRPTVTSNSAAISEALRVLANRGAVSAMGT
jgi:maleate isomerase